MDDVITRLKLYAAAIFALIVAAFGIRWQGAKSARDAEHARRLNKYKDTRRRMDDANADDLDADAARDWLRDRAKRDRDL